MNPNRARVLHEIKFIAESGLFDQEYYRTTYPDVAASGIHPIEHYVLYGAIEGRNPRSDFNTAAHSAQHSDAQGVNAFAHYLKHLKTERENPKVATLNDESAEATEYLEAISIIGERVLDTELFDEAYYIARHASTELLTLGSTHAAVTHYVDNAKSAGHNPCPLFDTQFYLKKYPDVAHSKINPLVHFSDFGAFEFRNPSEDFDTGWYWLIHQQDEGRHLNPLLHYQKFGQAATLSLKPTSKIELSQLDNACKKFLTIATPSITECLNVAKYLERIGRLANAELIYSHICNLGEVAEHFNTLARLYAAQKKWWQAIGALSSACELDACQSTWFARLGELCEKMNRFSDAIDAYSKALALQPTNDQWLYRLGYLHEKLEKEPSAKRRYQESIELSTNEAVKRFGVGIHHQSRGLWKEAAAAYGEQLETDPLDAELHYRQGMAHDRCFAWDMAAKSYRLAISLDSNTPYWFYRLGFVLERAGHFEESALAYCTAGERSKKHEAFWFYRQGYVLQQAGKFKQACHAYLRTSKTPPLMTEPELSELAAEDDIAPPLRSARQKALDTYVASFSRVSALKEIISKSYSLAKPHIELAEELEHQCEWQQAAISYARGIDRNAKHAPSWNYQRGYCLMHSSEFEDACKAFEKTRIIKKAYGFDYSKYEKNPELKNVIEYNELIETLPIDSNIVFYESYHGASVSCNPFAVFKELSSNPDYSHLIHVWALNDLRSAPKEMKNSPSIILVERSTYLYRYYIATAKYLINNNTFMPWFIRRPEQKYLNTWHGTPMKGLGKDIKSTFMSHKNVTRNFLQATHLLSPNSHTTDVIINRHDIAGSFSGIIAQTGYPRNDRVLKADPEVQAKLAKRLKLDPARPTALYAPTWRGTTSEPLVDIERLINDLSMLSELDCNLLFRGHHMSEKQISQYGFNSVPAEIETSELLSATDILITDYSSICFDFMPTGKPIIYYAYDYAEYQRDRGLYLDIHTLPGTVAETSQSLCEALEQAFTQLDSRLEISNTNLKYLDASNGTATASAVTLLFENDCTHAIGTFQDERKSILIYAGALPANGITQSCISLINAIDSSLYRVVLVIDPNTIEIEQYRLNKLEAISEKVQIISRVGIMNFSPEEKLVVDTFNQHNTLHSKEMWDIYRGAMRKEFKRIFGCANFDTIIQFEGYGRFWTALLGYGTEQSHKIIYLHNNMAEEFQTKYEFLAGIFKLYPCYKKLVSVSESVNEQNRKRLRTITNISDENFIYCDNYVNENEIEEKSQLPLDDDIRDWVGNSKLFGTVGRLSPEKGHYKLITAFAEYVQSTELDVKLVIVGDGSQWSILKQHIAELGLSLRVLLAGVRSNPYPIINALDLFVFSSDHEGQGLAIIEALILNKKVVSTDIPGPHSILAPGYGILVENSVQGLVDGMKSHFDIPNKTKGFSSKIYNKNVETMFLNAIKS